MVAPVKAEAQKVVSIEYTLKGDDGQVLDTSEGRAPLAYLHGAKNIVPGLEKAIEGVEVGQSVEVTVTPADGYGDYDARAVQNVPVRKLSEKRPAPGTMLQVQTQAGTRLALVKALRGDYATLDFNHPLAGKTLHFQVKVVDVREPTEEETAHGHVHGEGGHGH
jgi:FKBP-type peptidyl-prolyl cis-trans isomerase SlyD